MHDPSLRKIIKKTALIISFVLCVFSSLLAQEAASGSDVDRSFVKSGSTPKNKKGNAILKTGSAKPSSNKSAAQEEEILSELQKQGRFYRAQGLSFQRIGNLDAAMSLYQKAIELDPTYVVVYNDLGILYEEIGLLDRAEEFYLKAIKVDPDFLSAYSNLALVYETRRDLDKAVDYWNRRAELGSAADPWTQRAKQRASDIRTLQIGAPYDSDEQAVLGFMKDIQNEKAVYRENDDVLAKTHFKKAKLCYEKGDEVGALSEAFTAKQFDPSNSEIEDFIEKVQTRLLSK